MQSQSRPWRRRSSKKKFVWIFILLAGVSFFFLRPQPEWDVLSPEDRQTLTGVLTYWETWMPKKKADGIAPLITFEQLYHGLSKEETDFLDRIRAIRPKNKTYYEIPEGKISFEQVPRQQIYKDGNVQPIDPQYLPADVYFAYEEMMKGMEKDLGRRLFVESGYRSPAYQLYTFLFYTPKHHYSLTETRQWVALPGYSEHGAPDHQAIDFISESGVNGEERVEDFEELKEYHWLLAHAKEYGFVLSYPRGTKGTTFEPWHWRYEGDKV